MSVDFISIGDAMIEKIRSSFSAQAEQFESDKMNFSKKEYLDYTVKLMELNKRDKVLEVAAGTCACGRSIAPLVKEVICLDATDAMLNVGREEAAKSGIGNMQFVNGLAEQIPYEEGTFDVVLSRLAFHHFAEIEKPFEEMARVLKKGGKLVTIDMEAAREDLRELEDHLETLRDFSHVKNRSVQEFETLYENNHIKIIKKETTQIAVSLDAWLELTKTPSEKREFIREQLLNEMEHGAETGFQPFVKEGEIFFRQRWVIFVGEK